MMKNIKITGAKDLGKIQLFHLGRISNNYYNKIERLIKNKFILNIKLKIHEKAGTGDKEKAFKSPRKYGVQLQVKTSTNSLDSNASDWDLNRTLHSAFKKLLNEVGHRFMVS